MRRSFVIVLLAGLFAGSSSASDSVNVSGGPGSARLDYVGDDWRVGVGLSDEGDVVAELLGVIAMGERDSWVAEGWFQDGAGGVKLNYHWLPGDGDPALQDELPGVYKLYLAADQNRRDDRKLSLGAGYEKQDVFFSAQFSVGLTDERRIDDFSDISEQFLFGTDESGRPFRQLQTTTVLTEIFEQAYDYGVGLRLGRFFDRPNVRLQAGLDYEWGDFDSDQTTVSATAEKFFNGTGHSLALSVEHYEKSGDFELDDSDTRATLTWRYAFGRSYRPRSTSNAVAPPAPAQAEARETEPDPQPRTTTRVVRSNVDMESEAFFPLDSAEIRPESRGDLQEVADLITRGEILGRVSVVGHTCDLGPESYNKRLSNRRAESVKRELVSLGVDPEAIVTDGRGELEPAVPNTSEANRKLNRRVEVQFIRVEQTEEVVRIPPEPRDAPVAIEEEVVQEVPAWVMRALRNPAQHNRTVDVYRFERSTTTVALGEREFLNRAPLPENDTATAARNSSEVFIDVLANDADPDGDPLTVTSVSQPASGTVVNNGDFVTYTPAAGFQGEDSFTYSVSDGTETASATVTVTVSNDAPVLQADSAQTRAGTAVVIDVLANDSDPNGDELELISVSTASGGTSSIVGDGIRYEPNDGFNGTDTFTYTVRDAGGAEATAEVTVVVTNDAPVAQPDSAETPAGTPVQIDVLANDSDPNGDALELVAVSAASGGATSIVGEVVRYVPNDGFNGTDTFTYTVRDAGGAEASAEVTVIVTNDAPIAQPDSAETVPGVAVQIDVLANDSDPNGDALELVAVTAASGGSTSIVGDAVLYEPNAGFSGADTFNYTVRDTGGAEATGEVTVLVSNQPPVAADDSAQATVGQSVDIDVLANDFDPEGDSITLIGVGEPAFGTVQIVGDQIRYTANALGSGTDSFSYEIEAEGGQATGTVVVELDAPAPTAVDDSASTVEDTPVQITVLDNDAPALGQTLSIISVADAPNGATSIEGDAIVYTPDSGFVGTDIFEYTIREQNGATASATVTVTVTAASTNNPPIAEDDLVVTIPSLTVIADVLANDSDPDGDPLTIVDVFDLPDPNDGIITITSDNKIRFEPNNWDGVNPIRVRYRISDGQGGFAEATLEIKC